MLIRGKANAQHDGFGVASRQGRASGSSRLLGVEYVSHVFIVPHQLQIVKVFMGYNL